MRAFVVTAPGQGGVQEVERPTAAAGQVVVDVERVGVCGTDVEFFTGEMAYLHTGHASYPMRLGHEWCGTVASVGGGVGRGWLGARVTGDTMLGCGHCHLCAKGRQHVCEQRYEVGIRGGWPGALAEQVLVPASSLHRLPAGVDVAAGAMVEPGGNAFRAVQAAAMQPGRRLLIIGPGTIGLLCALFALAVGAEVHLLGHSDPPGVVPGLAGDRFWTWSRPPGVAFDAVIDASHGVDVPRQALDLVEPAGRVVYIGLAGEPSLIDTRTLVLRDLSAVGILSASPGLAATIAAYASGAVDPRPLIAATLGLEDVADVLAGSRPAAARPGPKVHIDPRR